MIHNAHKIDSKILKEERSVLVRVPANYLRSEEKYPVVYMLDAHAPQNTMMAAIVEQQSWGGMMPEMIVVGIQNTNRTRDFTPTKTERAGSGGAENFLRFIETEVIPFVEKNYRTQPYRILAGHSLGGLFSIYSFVERPDVFNAYIAASPVLHWDKSYVIKRAEETLKQNRDWNKRMFVAVSNEPDYFGGFNTFQEVLKKAKPKNFEYEFRLLKEENHTSIVLPAYFSGFRKVFEGWEQPANGTIDDLESHYKKLSIRFGYEILIPENTMNLIGYGLLGEGKSQEAIEVFKKNVKNYPKSANVYDSLAEAYEKNGQIKLSIENYEKALSTAQQNGDKNVEDNAKLNLERLLKNK